MERRELLKMIALVTGSAFIGGELLLSGCKNATTADTAAAFSEADIAFLDEVGETILPKTKTPGAKDAQVGKFMSVMVTDCYTKDEQAIFHAGLKKLEAACQKAHNTSFMKATPEQRKSLLISIDQEDKIDRANFEKIQNEKEKQEKEAGNHNFKKEKRPSHYFSMMKQLTLFGFFSSKPGATEALRYIAVPGKYDGNFPYKKGDRSWAS